MSDDDRPPSQLRDLNGTFEHDVRILSRDMINGRLVAAARALLGLDQIQLAERAGIRRQTLADLEGDIRRPQGRVREAVLAALEGAGIVFIQNGDKVGLTISPAAFHRT